MAKPHAVMLPLPTRGHVNPMMHFSKILAAQGFVITFVNTEFNTKLMAQAQSQPQLQNQGLDIRFVQLPDGLPPDLDRTTGVFWLLNSVSTKMGAFFQEFMETVMLKADPPVTCIISDTSMLFAQDVAHKLGIPHVNFWTQSAASYASIMLVIKGYRPPSEPRIPGTPPLQPSDMNSFVQRYDPTDFMFAFTTRPLERIGESAWILINTFDELEHETVEALLKEHRISTMGPMLPSSFLNNSIHSKNDTATLWPEEYDCLKWLDAHPPTSVLYVSFGSLALLSAKQLEEIALGLEASHQPFLWVARTDLMSGESAVFPEGFPDRVKERAAFVSWAPQLQVLSHSSLGGFFTHCGWNSTLESISAGVPMLGWPLFSDQMLDCRCIADGWKIGLSLEYDKHGSVSRVDVEKKVRDLMQSERGTEMRERARKLGNAARKAALEGGSSHKNLKLFVDAMKSLAGKQKRNDLSRYE